MDREMISARLRAPDSRRTGWALAVTGILVCALALVSFVEIALGAGGSASAWSGPAGLVLVFTVPMAIAARRRWLLGAYAAFVLAMLALVQVDWTTREPFLRDFQRVRVGMTRAEVDDVMGHWMRGTGVRLPDTPPPPVVDEGEELPDTSVYGDPSVWPELVLRDSEVFRHSDDGRFNADWGVVRYGDGRVVETRFSAD